MTDQQKNVPYRRFKEFENANAWEQRKLYEIAETTYGGGTPKTSISDYWNGKIPWVQSKDILENNVLNVAPRKYISNEAVQNSATKLIPANSIAIVTRVGVGKLAIMPYQYATSQDFLSLSNLKVDTLFAVYNLYKRLQRDSNFVQGTSIKGITKNELLNKKVMVPVEINEQSKIGCFFERLDHLITLHQRKYDKLKSLKSGYLTEMFPAEGERKPKRRFSGFTDDWEQRKLGELGSVAMNKRIFKNQTSKNGDVPFYKIGTFGKKPNSFITRELFEEYKQNYPYPEVGDILISASGSIGRTITYKGEDAYFQDSNIVWLKHDEKLNNSFLKQFYLIVKWQGLEGSTIKRLYNKNILNTEIYIPSVKEQQLIGSFLERLDNLITLHQQQLEKLKNFKQAYLNEMFV